MSQNSANAQKFVTVTEVAAEPVHVPIVVNNENFIVTQVDVRRIEDTRHITFNKLLATGEVMPLQQLDPSFQQNLMNTFRLVQKLLPDACFNDATLRNFIKKFMEKEALSQQQQRQTPLSALAPMPSCEKTPIIQHQYLQEQPQSTTAPASPTVPLFSCQPTKPLQQLPQSQPMGFEQIFSQFKPQQQWINRNDSKTFTLHTQATSTTEMSPQNQERRKSKSSNYRFTNDPPVAPDVNRDGQSPCSLGCDSSFNVPKAEASSAMHTQTIAGDRRSTHISTEMQTMKPLSHNSAAQTQRTQLVQAQTSTCNMGDSTLLMPLQPLPQSTQTHEPVMAKGTTPMALPMMAACKSRSMPLGIANN